MVQLDSPLMSVVTRTLATDTGFKERVREDMLVRLLDAFVWRNHGEPDNARNHRTANRLTTFDQIDKSHINSVSHMFRV